MPASTYRIIGLMSGTSLDGLDIACCVFEQNENKWNFVIEAAETYSYDEKWKKKLSTAHLSSGYELALAHTEYGYLLSEKIQKFIADKGISKVGFIASHGHTIFHQPEKNFTFQLGSGAAIAGRTGITTVCDFRTLDVALGGQGAPLVPIGDALLFNTYAYCLNIGGIANISGTTEGTLRAFDNCPANMVLNLLAQQLGKPYDENGEFARSGKLDNSLLEKLNNLDYYQVTGAKSLGREWVETVFMPVLNSADSSAIDKLNTVCEHIAIQVAKHAVLKGAKMLVTGGGAHNKWLIERIKAHTPAEVVIPEKKIVDFKEALVFAFLGLLRIEQKNNTLASVTGATSNSTGGAVYAGKS